MVRALDFSGCQWKAEKWGYRQEDHEQDQGLGQGGNRGEKEAVEFWI